MAASLEIHDLYDVGQVQVLLVETSGESRETPPRAFSVELSEEERGALDRYHTEYRGGSPGRIAQIEAVELAMRNLGRLLFESAFAADTGSREILDEVMGARRSGRLDARVLPTGVHVAALGTDERPIAGVFH